jgi:hypothetical protein
MLIQRLQKCWIENPSLLTCVKTIQNSAYSIVLDGFTAELHFGQNDTLAKDTLAGTLWPEKL